MILMTGNLNNDIYIVMNQKPKYFDDAALSQGPAYFEYENYEIETNNDEWDRYEVMEKIGRGKYSDVFKCIDTSNDSLSVLKILKPVRDSKIRREIKILKTLKGLPNIISLDCVMLDPCSKCYCLVYPYVNHIDIRDLPDQEIKLPLIKKFTRQILKALQQAHRRGIMHRDIKPQNILFDKNTKDTFVADWGLADYYLPSRQYNVRVASRYYKGPQLLLNHKYYGYSLDIWSLGCVLAGLLFQKTVFFRGDSNPDQMRVILDHVGSEEVDKYIKRYKIKPDRDVVQIIQEKNRPKKPWSKYITTENQDLVTPDALDLLEKMLVIDHEERINCTEALKHRFLK